LRGGFAPSRYALPCYMQEDKMRGKRERAAGTPLDAPASKMPSNKIQVPKKGGLAHPLAAHTCAKAPMRKHSP
jgi:hypothetical protein